MRTFALALALGALLALEIALRTSRLDPVVVATAAIAAGVAAASACQGGPTWLAVGLGALSPLAFATMARDSPVMGVAAMTCLWLAPRAWMARTKSDALLVGAGSVLASGLAAAVAWRYRDAAPTEWLAACTFAGASLAMTTVVRIDTPTAHALSVAARALDEPLAAALERAAELHRSRDAMAKDGPVPPSRWRALVALADRAVTLRGLAGDEATRVRDEVRGAILAEVDAILGASPAPKTPDAEPAAEPSGVGEVPAAAAEAPQGGG